MKSSEENAKEILQGPYSWLVVPDVDTGLFAARILEFRGCYAQGSTKVEAISNLESAAISWLMSLLERGLPVPSPKGADIFTSS